MCQCSRRSFRFGLVAGYAPDPESWKRLAIRAEELGYDVLLVPDSLTAPSPVPALAAAASVTSTLRIGTHVLAAPFRTPGTVARDADALDLLSGGRFELGLGAGRPDARAEAERLGMSWGTAAERLQQVDASITEVRTWFAEKGAEMPPVMLAGVGSRLMKMAARQADVLALGLSPSATEEELGHAVDRFRRIAGDRADRVELATNLLVLGDQVPEPILPFIEGLLGSDLETARTAGAYAVMDGDPGSIANRLWCRRHRWGISYATVPQQAMEDFAAVIPLLREADLCA